MARNGMKNNLCLLLLVFFHVTHKDDEQESGKDVVDATLALRHKGDCKVGAVWLVGQAVQTFESRQQQSVGY